MKNFKRIAVVLFMMVLMLHMATPVEAASVKLNKKKITLCTGETYQLKVTGTNKKVKWSTSNKKVATVKKGKVTAKRKGTAKITAKVGKNKYTCKVTVKKTKLEYDQYDGWIAEGVEIEQYAYCPVSFKTNAKKITWSSSNKKVANVCVISDDGHYAWIWGYGKGTATITVKAGDVKKTIKVVVRDGKETIKYNEFKWSKATMKACDGYSNFVDWSKYKYSKTKKIYYIYWDDKKNLPAPSMNRGVTIGSTTSEVHKAYSGRAYDHIDDTYDGYEAIVTSRYLNVEAGMNFYKCFVYDPKTDKVVRIEWICEKCL